MVNKRGEGTGKVPVFNDGSLEGISQSNKRTAGNLPVVQLAVAR